MELIFTFIIGVLVYTEHKLYKTFLTPFSIIALVYTALILVNNFIAIKMDFFKVSTESIFIIFCFLILIFFISMCFYFLMTKKPNIAKENDNNYISNVVYRNKEVILILFMIGLIAKYLSLFQAINLYGLANIKGEASGILAHIGIIGVVLTPYIMILYLQKKNKILLSFIVLIYLNLFLFGGKYEIIIAFIQLFALYAMIKKVDTKRTFKLGAIGIFFIIMMFIIVYAIRPLIIDGYFDESIFLNNIYFSLKHLMFYLVSPLIATDYFFNNGTELVGGLQILFSVPINIVKAIFRTGAYVNPVYSNFIPVSTTYTTNVGGLFAESVYCSGFFVASVYIGLFFVLVYYYYIKSKYRGEMLSLTSLMLAVVTISFFGNILTASGVVLQIIYLWIIESFLKKKIVFRS